jgi:hypothetical protein
MSPVRIAVSGMGRDRMKELLERRGGNRVEVRALSDIEGVTALQRDEVDYYVGACLSGAGGALAMATAMLGPERAVRLSGLGGMPDPAEIRRRVDEGARAFGLMSAHVDAGIPPLLDAILDRASRSST